jgi:Ran-binding protein 1
VAVIAEEPRAEEPPAIAVEPVEPPAWAVIAEEPREESTGEEEEEILCSYRSKLFVYGETLLDKGTGIKTWKERGIGEARILRNCVIGHLRFLMRQEQTMKVIANHALDPRIELAPNAGSDRSWVWSCFDYADGELEEKVFALRFLNSEVAKEFKAKYQECQAEMARLLAAGEDATGGDAGDAKEIVKAFGGLSTKGE